MTETEEKLTMTVPAPAAPGGNNVVSLTGRVIARWVFEGDTYLRLVALRPRGFPPAPDGRRGDVLVARVNYFLAQTAPLPERGQLCRVQGFLQQVDGAETLETALERLEQPEHAPAVKQALGALLDLGLKRPTTEIVALKWQLLPEPERRGHERRRERKSTPSLLPAAPAEPGETDGPAAAAAAE